MQPPAEAPARSFERLAGAALGAMCGDALGMPVEGWPPQDIARQHGRLDRMLPGRLVAGSYTDDSQMMIAILETLAHCDGLDPAFLAGRFAALYDPARGYGGRIHGVMTAINQGVGWQHTGTDSWGNGGAMRVGVLGAFYAGQKQAQRQAALDQCRITHTHTRALAGAAAQALAVGMACVLGAAGRAPKQERFVSYLAEQVSAIDSHVASRLRAMPPLPQGDESACRLALTNEYACDVSAAEAVPAAIGSFLGAESAEQAVVLAISLGGDTDTVGAMAGAMAGAFGGIKGLPTAWLESLENLGRGRDYVLMLCESIIPKNC